MKKYLTLSIFLLFTNICFGDIKLSYSKAKSMVGVTSPKIIGDRIIIGEDSVPQITSVAIINVDSTTRFKIKARKSLFETSELVKLTDTDYMLAGEGKFLIEVMNVDEEKELEITLGPVVPPTPPTPPVPPSPPPSPIPSDLFDNIGQRVAVWAKDCPKRKELSACYLKTATTLRTIPSATVNSAISELVTCRTTLLNTDIALYKTMLDNINTDVATRGPMSKAVYADYFEAISKGLQ